MTICLYNYFYITPSSLWGIQFLLSLIKKYFWCFLASSCVSWFSLTKLACFLACQQKHLCWHLTEIKWLNIHQWFVVKSLIFAAQLKLWWPSRPDSIGCRGVCVHLGLNACLCLCTLVCAHVWFYGLSPAKPQIPISHIRELGTLKVNQSTNMYLYFSQEPFKCSPLYRHHPNRSRSLRHWWIIA